MKNICVPILSLFISFSPILANEKSDTLDIRFRQGRSDLEAGFAGNEAGLRLLDSISSLGDARIRSISITGAASPEGSVVLNDQLSNDRAERVAEIFNEAFPNKDERYMISFTGRDWSRLLEMISKDNEVPFKEDTENLLISIVERIGKTGKEQQSDLFLESLKILHDGEPYNYLYKNVFPSLRDARVVFDYIILPQLDTTCNYIPAVSIYPPVNPSAIRLNPLPSKAGEGKNFYMALKTNMLFDVMALPSLSAEFYLGKNFSMVTNWTYGWWDTDRTHHYWRAYGGDLAVRWWFGKKAALKPLTGHHLGIYGGILTYDFEFGRTGYMGGLPHETLWNRSLRMVGIEYGYSLPIARRFNIDFTIGFGYLGGKYIEYIPENGRYLWQSTHKINWLGPTKAEISLVWLIGNGNFNESFNRSKK